MGGFLDPEPAHQEDEKQQRKPAAEVEVHQFRSAQTKNASN